MTNPCSEARGLLDFLDPFEFIVRLGQLCFDDFLLLEPLAARRTIADLESAADIASAFSNRPDMELRFRRLEILGTVPSDGRRNPGQSPDFLIPAPAEISAAGERLVRRHALVLLKHKAPPLYDALPWHDWDFSIVTRRFKLWQTRLLLAGEGTCVTVSRLNRTAGIHIWEPLAVLRRYVERKAAVDKVKRVSILNPGGQFPAKDAAIRDSFRIPLPDSSIDLAILGSLSDLLADGSSFLADLRRVAANVLVVENCPLVPPLDETTFLDRGFARSAVEVRSMELRPCWWMGV